MSASESKQISCTTGASSIPDIVAPNSYHHHQARKATIGTLGLPTVDKAMFIGTPSSGADIFGCKSISLLLLTDVSSSLSHNLIKLYLRNNIRADEEGFLLPTRPLRPITGGRSPQCTDNQSSSHQLRLAKNTLPKEKKKKS